MESWSACKGYEGAYEVSNFGKVRSLDRIVYRSDTGTGVLYKGCIIAPVLDRRGYECVHLSLNNVSKRFRVHRLVAEAFIQNLEGKPQVNHKEGVKTNNRVENLEWVTNLENMQHANGNNLRPDQPCGEDSYRFSGTVIAIDMDGNIVARMSGNKEMKSCGFDFRLISAVLHGKRKSHNGCTFIKQKEV